MSYDAEIEQEKADWLGGVAMQLEWQNALMAELIVEIQMMRYEMSGEDYEAFNSERYETAMSRADYLREMFKTEYHPSVKRHK